jgi:hypothetical protein
VSKPEGERQLTTRRDAEHRGALGRQRDSEARSHPSADFLDEEPLVSSEPLRFESGRVLLQPQRLVVQPVYADDHRRRYAGRLQDAAPVRDQPAVTREHDCLRWDSRDVDRHGPTAVVLERLGDELPRDTQFPTAGSGMNSRIS